MPGRNFPLINGEVYHLVNRGTADQPVFLSKTDYSRILNTLTYYQNNKPLIRYSFYINLSIEKRKKIIDSFKKNQDYLIDIICYCFMPNHIHILVRQLKDSGISKFMSNVSNSYSKYFNTKMGRHGPIFQGRFKAVRIENEEQLLHVSRYIHLNPFSSYLLNSTSQLEMYPHSSFGEYVKLSTTNICQKDLLLTRFKNHTAYKQFVLDQADYQKNLQNIKHLLLEQ